MYRRIAVPLGSVSASVFRHFHVPVLVVHEDESAAPAVDVSRTIHKMLIALDGARFGDEIPPHATMLLFRPAEHHSLSA